VVGAGNSTRLAEKLRAAGNDATAVIYPRIGHYLIVAAIAPVIRALVPVLGDIDDFIAKVLKSRPRAQVGEAAP
jgi:dipeptidyl aminopeptidase/acylaminoacyl peptidase